MNVIELLVFEPADYVGALQEGSIYAAVEHYI